MSADLRLLRSRNLLVLGEESGAAVITAEGWLPLPEPLASTVRAALEGTDDDAA